MCSPGIVARVDPDLQLLKDTLAGDRSAREAFAGAMLEHLHGVLAYWFARYGVPGRIQHDMDDIAHTAMMSLFERDAHKLAEYDVSGGKSVRGWVALIGKNVLVDALRKNPEKVFRYADGDESVVAAIPSGADSVEDTVSAARLLALLRARLANPDDPEDLVILEMRLDGHTTAEIAFLLGCSVVAAESRIARWQDRVCKILWGGGARSRTARSKTARSAREEQEET